MKRNLGCAWQLLLLVLATAAGFAIAFLTGGVPQGGARIGFLMGLIDWIFTPTEAST